MKKSVLTLLMGMSGLAYGQIALEHTYEGKYVDRLWFEYDGPVFHIPLFKNGDDTSLVLTYHPDHSLWKKVLLPSPGSEYNMVMLVHITQAVVNPDSLLEAMYIHMTVTDQEVKHTFMVSNENGQILLRQDSIMNFGMLSLSGLQDKLILGLETGWSSWIYALPGLTLEHVYPSLMVQRTILENSGEKYFHPDHGTGQVRLYNADRSSWKDVSVVLPPNVTNWRPYEVSEHLFNSNDKLEIVYSITYTANGNDQFKAFVMDEDGNILLAVDNGSNVEINRMPGLSTKLFVSGVDSLGSFTKVFEAGTLVEEHHYASQNLKRAWLENSGEIYYTFDNNGSEVYLFDSGHNAWKTLTAPIATGAVLQDVAHVSETILDPDALVEEAATYKWTNSNNEEIISALLFNENEDLLLQVDSILTINVDTMAGEPNVLCLSGGFLWNNNYVYSLPAPLSLSETVAPKVLIFPNPVSGTLRLKGLESMNGIQLQIYNTAGQMVHEVENFDGALNVSDLNPGVYILKGSINQQPAFTTRFIVK